MHFLWEHLAFSQQCLSNSLTWLDRSLFAFLVIAKSIHTVKRFHLFFVTFSICFWNFLQQVCLCFQSHNSRLWFQSFKTNSTNWFFFRLLKDSSVWFKTIIKKNKQQACYKDRIKEVNSQKTTILILKLSQDDFLT